MVACYGYRGPGDEACSTAACRGMESHARGVYPNPRSSPWTLRFGRFAQKNDGAKMNLQIMFNNVPSRHTS